MKMLFQTYFGTIYMAKLQMNKSDLSYCIYLEQLHLNKQKGFETHYSFASKSFNIAQDCTIFMSKFTEVSGRLYLLILQYNIATLKVTTIHILRCHKNQVESIKVLNIPEKIKLLVNESELQDSKRTKHSGYIELLTESTVCVISNKYFCLINLRNSASILDKHSFKDLQNAWFTKAELLQDNTKVVGVVLSLPFKIVGMAIHIKCSKYELRLIENIQCIPAQYAPVVVALFPQCEHSQKLNLSDWESVLNNLFHSVIIATSRMQILMVKGGKVLTCITAPFTDISSVQSFTNNLGDTPIIFMSESHQLWVINREYKEVVRIESISFCLVDDFIKNGSLQMLACLLDHLGKPSKLVLSDLASCHIDTFQNTCTESDDNDEAGSLKMVIKALQNKLQQSVAELYQLEQQCRQRDQLVEDITACIQHGNSDQNHMFINSPHYLVPLLGNNSKSGCNPVKGSTSKYNLGIYDNLVCSEIWQRILGDNWVVCATVCNKTNRVLNNIEMELIPLQDKTGLYTPNENRTYSTALKSTHHPQIMQPDDQPVLKKPKLQGTRSNCVYEVESNDTVEVVVVTKIPSFYTSLHIQYGVNLNWIYKEMSDSGSDCNSTRHAKYIGTISLSSKDVLTEKYHCNLRTKIKSNTDLMQDLIAMDSCQKKTYLNIRSTYSHIKQHLECMLKQTTIAVQTPFSYGSHLQHMIGEGPLQNSRIEIVELGRNEAIILTYTRDESQLLLLIHQLYENLPDDIIIQLKADNTGDTADPILTAMNKEILFTKSAFTKLIRKTEEKGKDICSSDSKTLFSIIKDKEDLDTAKKEFQNLQHSLAKVQPQMVDSNQLSAMLETKLALEKETDSKMSKIGKH